MSDELGLGKVSKKIFQRSVLPYINLDRVELDGATIQLTDHTVIAHSPSIGVPLEALGFFAFHYAASNVASRFGKPTHMIIGIYLPLKTKEKDLQTIAKNLGDEAGKYGVQISAGQTATYYGLDIPLITATCLGEAIRVPYTPKQGDIILILNEIGGESVWLNKLSQGKTDKEWKNFTPLPVIQVLQQLNHVKVMHDVSEGGVKGALFELADDLKMRTEIKTDTLIYNKDAKNIGNDILRAPTYGTLVAIIDSEGLDTVKARCEEHGIPCAVAGTIESGTGLYVDGQLVKEQKRINLDKIYGAYFTEE